MTENPRVRSGLQNDLPGFREGAGKNKLGMFYRSGARHESGMSCYIKSVPQPIINVRA